MGSAGCAVVVTGTVVGEVGPSLATVDLARHGIVGQRRLLRGVEGADSHADALDDLVPYLRRPPLVGALVHTSI